MNTYSLKAMNVNGGTVQASEQPLWAGTSTVPDAVNGRCCAMSVTLDRDWLWVRFSQQPSEKYRKELQSLDFVFSRKRQGWHAPLTAPACDKLARWGAITVDYYKLASDMPKRPQPENLTKHIDLDAPVRDAIARKEKQEKQASQQASKSKGHKASQSQPAGDANTMAMMAEMMKTMQAMTQTIVNLQAQVMEMQQASQPKPQPATNYSNGYHVGGIKLG